MHNKLVAGLDAKVKTGLILTFEPSAGKWKDAVRALQQQVNEFTDFDNQENVPVQMRTHWKRLRCPGVLFQPNGLRVPRQENDCCWLPLRGSVVLVGILAPSPVFQHVPSQLFLRLQL